MKDVSHGVSGNITKVGKTKIPGAEDRKGPEIKVRAG